MKGDPVEAGVRILLVVLGLVVMGCPPMPPAFHPATEMQASREVAVVTWGVQKKWGMGAVEGYDVGGHRLWRGPEGWTAAWSPRVIERGAESVVWVEMTEGELGYHLVSAGAPVWGTPLNGTRGGDGFWTVGLRLADGVEVGRQKGTSLDVAGRWLCFADGRVVDGETGQIRAQVRRADETYVAAGWGDGEGLTYLVATGRGGGDPAAGWKMRRWDMTAGRDQWEIDLGKQFGRPYTDWAVLAVRGDRVVVWRQEKPDVEVAVGIDGRTGAEKWRAAGKVKADLWGAVGTRGEGTGEAHDVTAEFYRIKANWETGDIAWEADARIDVAAKELGQSGLSFYRVGGKLVAVGWMGYEKWLVAGLREDGTVAWKHEYGKLMDRPGRVGVMTDGNGVEALVALDDGAVLHRWEPETGEESTAALGSTGWVYRRR